MSVVEAKPTAVEVALEREREYLSRELPAGLLEFESTPSYRAYYWTPAGDCVPCGGSGRMPSLKRKGSTVQCKDCHGSGDPKRSKLVSVTTLLNDIVPKDLSYWGEAQGIMGAVVAIQQGLMDIGVELDDAVEIVRYEKLGKDAARDRAASRGVDVHAMLEAFMLGGDAPNIGDVDLEQQGFVQALCRFLVKYRPQPLPEGGGVEELVCHPELGFAGRSDLRCVIGGKRVRLDLKTQSKGNAYASSILQATLYECAGRWCGDTGSDELWIVSLPQDGFAPAPVIAEYDAALVDAALRYRAVLKPIDGRMAKRNKTWREVSCDA